MWANHCHNHPQLHRKWGGIQLNCLWHGFTKLPVPFFLERISVKRSYGAEVTAQEVQLLEMILWVRFQFKFLGSPQRWKISPIFPVHLKTLRWSFSTSRTQPCLSPPIPQRGHLEWIESGSSFKRTWDMRILGWKSVKKWAGTIYYIYLGIHQGIPRVN